MCETSLVGSPSSSQIEFEMTRRLCFAPSCLLFAAAVGCGSDSVGSGQSADDTAPGGQTGEEQTGCLPIEGGVDTLAWSERSPLGFSADELLGSVGSNRDTRLTWSNGSSTPLRLELERSTGEVAFQIRDWRDDGSGRELAAGGDCNDALVVPVTLSLDTGDGALAESWALELVVEMAGQASAFHLFELDTLEGSYVPNIDTSTLKDLRGYIDVTLAATSWSGQLRGQGTRTQGAGPNASVSSQEFPIATF
jgi:hypothetical protein